jgi:transposase-like protein
MATNNLSAPQFQDADKARQYLEAQTWPNGPVCPHCGVVGGHYALKGKTTRDGLYKCKDCREPFTVTVGTVFERSKIPLNKWLMAVYLIASSKKGISSHQIHRTIGVSYKTAWFMAHRIREAMASPIYNGQLGGGGAIVEIDETFIGRKADKTKRRGAGHKHAVFSLVQRDGGVRSFHVANVTADTLKPILLKQVSPDAHVFTDSAGQYRKAKLGKMFAKHEKVNHLLGEYARGNVHTNTVEGYFSILKRGTYHHVSEAHLQRYVNEFDFRYSNRTALGVSDAERADKALKGISGKRLMYKGPN